MADVDIWGSKWVRNSYSWRAVHVDRHYFPLHAIHHEKKKNVSWIFIDLQVTSSDARVVRKEINKISNDTFSVEYVSEVSHVFAYATKLLTRKQIITFFLSHNFVVAIAMVLDLSFKITKDC